VDVQGPIVDVQGPIVHVQGSIVRLQGAIVDVQGAIVRRAGLAGPEAVAGARGPTVSVAAQRRARVTAGARGA
jgi:hypothetical protein